MKDTISKEGKHIQCCSKKEHSRRNPRSAQSEFAIRSATGNWRSWHRWRVPVSLVSVFCSSLALAQESLWEKYIVAGNSLRAQAKYNEAEKSYLDAVHEAEKWGDPRLGKALNFLASVYFDQGRYAEAEPLLQRSIVILEKTLGPDHPDVATTLKELFRIRRTQSQFVEAEALCHRVIAICQKALGPEHPLLASGLNNLGALYLDQGKFAEAELYFRQALSIWEKAGGPNHPEVAKSLSNLGHLYYPNSLLSKINWDREELC